MIVSKSVNYFLRDKHFVNDMYNSVAGCVISTNNVGVYTGFVTYLYAMVKYGKQRLTLNGG